MHAQRGNILFLILLAVILFAALSYAVTSSLKGGGNNASEEKVKLMAAQIVSNANAVENQIMRAMLVDKIPLHGFDVSGTQSLESANATCTQTACKIFTTAGVASLAIPSWALNPGTAHLAKYRFVMGQIVNVGTSANDFLLFRMGLSREVCAEINRSQGASDIDETSAAQGWNWGSTGDYAGTLTDVPASTIILGNTITAIAGKRSFCFATNDALNSYVFIHVLVAR